MSMEDLFPPLVNKPNPMDDPAAPAFGRRGHVEPYEAEDDPDFSYDGFQVTRREYYAHNNEPAISFSDGRLGINAVCLKKAPDVEYVQILVNREKKKLVIRPCTEDDWDSFMWCTRSHKSKSIPAQKAPHKMSFTVLGTEDGAFGHPKTKKGGQPKPTAVMMGLFSFAVVAGHPADLTVDDHRMPPVFSRCHPFKGRAVLRGGDAAVLRPVAGADVDGAAGAYDAHALGCRGDFFGCLGLGLTLALVIIRNGIHGLRRSPPPGTLL